MQDVQTFIPGPVNQPGNKVAQTTVKATNPTAGQVAPPADQFELYNATADPAELANLYGNAAYADTPGGDGKLLQAQRDAKRLTPLQEPWASRGSTQQFPFARADRGTHEDGDDAVGVLGVVVIGGPDGCGAIPPRLALCADHLAHREVMRLRFVLDHDHGVRDDVQTSLGSPERRPCWQRGRTRPRARRA